MDQKVKDGNNEPLDCIVKAIEAAGYKTGKDISMALDVASSEFWNKDHYELKLTVLGKPQQTWLIGLSG